MPFWQGVSVAGYDVSRIFPYRKKEVEVKKGKLLSTELKFVFDTLTLVIHKTAGKRALNST